jgi:hypothetical protein
MNYSRKLIAQAVDSAHAAIAEQTAALPALQRAAAVEYLRSPKVNGASPSARISHMEDVLAGLAVFYEEAEYHEIVSRIAAGPGAVEGAGSQQGSLNWHGLHLKQRALEAKYPHLRAAAKGGRV